MSFKKLLLTVLLLAALPAIVAAQQIEAGVEFETFFDNREYSGNRFSESETFFSARLTPEAALRWDDRNRLAVGVELLQDFGDGAKFLTEAKPLMYYSFRTPKVLASAGIFPRSQLIGSYSEAFFDRAVRFYDNRLSGLLGHYRTERGYVELLVDWEGMRTESTREKFRILSAGAYGCGRFYFGYAFSMVHYAKSKLETPEEGVVDNFLMNPYVGMKFSAFFDFDLRLGYLQGMQRDRRTSTSDAPAGGEFVVSMSRKGFTLSNHLYLGENQMPFWNIYGAAVYSGSPFFSTTEHIYNRTSIDYGRTFFNGTLDVRAGFLFHYDGIGMGVQQVVDISVKLQKCFGKRGE